MRDWRGCCGESRDVLGRLETKSQRVYVMRCSSCGDVGAEPCWISKGDGWGACRLPSVLARRTARSIALELASAARS